MKTKFLRVNYFNNLKLEFAFAFILVLIFTFSAQAKNKYSLIKAFPNLKFDQPVLLTHSPDGKNKIFVVQRGGKILTFDNKFTDKNSEVFLDISSKALTTGNEEGLLGFAFHPDFKTNGYFYIDYVADNPVRTVISRFKVNKNGKADISSEQIILQILQPFSNHKGGMLAFGPDGYLYTGTGDGGNAGDPNGNGQNKKVLLGKILRLDINHKTGYLNYSIPKDNPYFKNTQGYKQEIWAIGMRNPWRFSFDKATGQLWVADVGQNNYEEIDLIEKGKDYGWNIMEGLHCYKPEMCDKKGLTLPILEYSHTQGNCITGGYVYNGANFPELKGTYIYGDFVNGKIWSLKNKKINSLLFDSDLLISSFGIDQFSELYIIDYNKGEIYKLKSI